MVRNDKPTSRVVNPYRSSRTVVRDSRQRYITPQQNPIHREKSKTIGSVNRIPLSPGMSVNLSRGEKSAHGEGGTVRA